MEDKKKFSDLFIVRLIMDNKFFILFIALIIIVRVYVISINEVVNISMEPTLNEGDVVMIDKKIYNLTGFDRFDVVVFNYSESDEEKFLIKRVIGLPGETVEMVDGVLYVDGEEIELDEDMATLNIDTNDFNSGVIADDEYYVLGDNRMNSLDSRSFGSVNKDEMVGHAFLKFRPLSEFKFLINYLQ